MTDKKEKPEHHLTKAKRLREEALANTETVEAEEVSTPEIVELEKKVAKLEKATSRPFYVYDSKANIVAYCVNEDEANEVVKKYVGGWKQMI